MLTTTLLLIALSAAPPAKPAPTPPTGSPAARPPSPTLPGIRPPASGQPKVQPKITPATRPNAPAAPPKPAPTGDAAFDAIRDQFSGLAAWLKGKPQIGADERREIGRVRSEIAAFVASHPDHAAALGMLVQTDAWLGDLDAADAGFSKLAALRPDDGSVLINWANFWRNRNQFERALAAASRYPVDVAVFPKIVPLRAELLMALHRFEDAEAALAAIPDPAAAPPDIAFQLNRMKTAAAEYKQFWAAEQELRAKEAAADNLPRVELVTDRGRMVLELFEDSAPNTVANFVDLASKGFYDGLTFHRVLPAFMAQGGDPNSRAGGVGAKGAIGTGGPGYRILGEATKPEARKHFAGSISMAHDANPDNNGSQFFICFAPAAHLNGVHTVFGRVIEGEDVLMKTQQQDVIRSAKVLRKRDHEYKPETLPEAAPPAPPTPPPTGIPTRVPPPVGR
ncbi:MAG: peptidylprolyl isomerase [Phycisphaerales bacterium]